MGLLRVAQMLVHFCFQHLLESIAKKISKHSLDILSVPWFVVGEVSLNDESFFLSGDGFLVSGK